MSIQDCRVIELPKISDPRGNLTFIEGNQNIPFEIRRVFYLYGVPTGESRGAHAHRNLEQCLVCLAGSFDVTLDDGVDMQTVHLDKPWSCLYVPPMIWAAEVNFDPGTVCLVLASAEYDETDHIRDKAEFLATMRERKR